MDFTKIKDLRKGADLSRLELSRRSGVADSTICDLETGHTRGKALETLRALGDALGFDSLAAFIAHLDDAPAPEVTTSSVRQETWQAIANEVNSARAKHPSVNITALMEEVGELAHDLLEDAPGWYAEAAQVACVAIRIMEEGCDLHRPVMVLDAPECDDELPPAVKDRVEQIQRGMG